MKAVVFINWIMISVYALFCIMLIIDLGKPTDAFGRSLTSGFLTIGLILLALLVIFTLIPSNVVRVLGLLVGLSPLITWVVSRSVSDIQIARQDRARKNGSLYFKNEKLKKLATAIAYKKKEEVNRLLEDPELDLNQIGHTNRTILGLAAEHDSYFSTPTSFDLVKMLLAKGADPNLHASDQPSVLSQIASSGSVALFRLLLENGADPNAIGPDSTAVIFELLRGSSERDEKMQLLLDYGANPNITWGKMDWRKNHSPLIYAVSYNYWKTCVILINAGADLNFVAPNGSSFWTYFEQYKKEYEGAEFIPEDFLELVSLMNEQQ